jgi:hypothetical protein
VTSSQAGDHEDAVDVANWPAEDRALYRHFCKDVRAAEEQWNHSKTSHAMASLRGREPQLCPTFFKCLAIARKTMGEDVVYEWQKFQEQGWERRRQHGYGVQPPETTGPSFSPSAADPARRDVVAAAYREFQETAKARTNDWKARFQYRRATVGLAVQCEAYAQLRDKRSVRQPTATQTDRSTLLRALFREMQPKWLHALPCDFTDKQAKDQGHGQDWKAFSRAIQDGRRWKVLVEDLGFGALLLIDTSGNVDYIQQQIPIPVFAAWARLIPRVRLDVKEVAARVEGYFDGMEVPSFYAVRKLRPLKLERHAYRACSPSEQFEFSGSEGGRTPTADPRCLTRPGGTVVYGEDYAIEDFIQSSGFEDEDFADLSGSNV